MRLYVNACILEIKMQRENDELGGESNMRRCSRRLLVKLAHTNRSIETFSVRSIYSAGLMLFFGTVLHKIMLPFSINTVSGMLGFKAETHILFSLVFIQQSSACVCVRAFEHLIHIAWTSWKKWKKLNIYFDIDSDVTLCV